jgi:hypothetical protein
VFSINILTAQAISTSALPYSEHLGTTFRARTLGGRPTVLHRDCLWVLHLMFGTTLHAIRLHRTSPFAVKGEAIPVRMSIVPEANRAERRISLPGYTSIAESRRSSRTSFWRRPKLSASPKSNATTGPVLTGQIRVTCAPPQYSSCILRSCLSSATRRPGPRRRRPAACCERP